MVGNPRNLLLTSVQSHLRFCSLTQHEANSTVVFVCAAASAESPEAAERGERLPRVERRLRAEGRRPQRAAVRPRRRRGRVGREQRERPAKQSGGEVTKHYRAGLKIIIGHRG